jgi:hypothetical protein
MENAKHTPGPWRSERGNGDYGRNVTADNGRRIVCETICAEHEANARLIAAAPELLEALHSILEHSREFGDIEDCETMLARIEDKVRAAIAKAEGR